jgi:4-hydroxythreonine-4-phosphate dehydrogenase
MSTTPPESAVRPLIALTMGDPCGIGPEIIAKALGPRPDIDLVVIGDVETMRRAVALAGTGAQVAWIGDPRDRVGLPSSALPVLPPPDLPADLETLPPGHVDARAGAAAARCIEQAVRWVNAGACAAVVTAPIHKEALALAGLPWPGHTEMLQSLAAPPDADPPPVRMMLASPELRVVLVTVHVSLRRALDLVTIPAVLQTLRIAHAALRRLGVPEPRIGVAGLNPHAGEGGLFGDEEVRVIAPAIAVARGEGIDARGPFPPDTVFMRARDVEGHPGEFDAVVAMTHDHGLIPVKYLGVEHGVNVTLGLPFVRTSPDHGTAFDIAWTGRADPRSFSAALAAARRFIGSATRH